MRYGDRGAAALDGIDWGWADARLGRLRALGVRDLAPVGLERRRNFRPWRYEQAGAWI